MKDYIKLIRLKHWVKNLFVFAPLIFSQFVTDIEKIKIEFLTFLAFSFVASATYIINDILDAESDRKHPIKRNRPIASGRIKPSRALFVVFCFLLASIPIMSELPLRASALIVFYFLLMLAYSFSLKGVVLLDVFIIAFGFMLRVIVGAYSINVIVSKWLFITTLFLSLFLAISKRRMELFFSFQNRESQISEQRKVLDEYTLRFADQMVTITASGAVISYALYTISERTVSLFKTEALIYTTVFVLYGIFRYMYLIYRKNIGENPTDIILSDAPMLINILLWFVSCVIIIYRNKIFEVFSLN